MLIASFSAVLGAAPPGTPIYESRCSAIHPEAPLCGIEGPDWRFSGRAAAKQPPATFWGSSPDAPQLLPPPAPTPQNAAVPFPSSPQLEQPCPALFSIVWVSLFHPGSLQHLFLFPLAHLRSNLACVALRAVFHSYLLTERVWLNCLTSILPFSS
jgi:hypothetical protein